MNISRPAASLCMTGTDTPPCAPQPPVAQHSQDLLNGDCWRAVSEHLSARDVVRLSQVDRRMWQLFSRPRKLLDTLVERYYGIDKDTQQSWCSALEEIPWSGRQRRFRLWQKHHLHNKKDREWVNSDPLRQRALFRYLSSYPGKIPCLRPRRGPDHSLTFCMTPLTGSRLAAGNFLGKITVWNLTGKTGQQCDARLTEQGDIVHHLRVLDNGMLVSTSCDQPLKIWDLSKPAGLECITTLPADSCTFNATVLPDHRLVSFSPDNRLIIWDLTHLPEWQRINSVKINAHILCMDTLNGLLVCGCNDNTLKILDLSPRAVQKLVATLKGHVAPVRCLIPLPDGTIASGSYDHKVKIWDPNLPPDSCCINTLDHLDAIYSLVILPDGRLVAGVNNHGLVIWDLTRPYPECAIQLQKHDLWTLSAIHLNGQVISHNADHLRIWRLGELIDNTKSLPDGSLLQQDVASCAAAGPVSSRTRSQTGKRKANDEPAVASKHPRLNPHTNC